MRSAMRVRTWLAVVAAVAVTGALTAQPVGANTGAENDFVSRINAARSSNGLPQLAVHAELVDVARRWSAKMAANNRLSHNPNVQNEVTADWDRLAENVGVGGSVEQIHDAFMGSSGHRANILHREMSHVGVGVVITGEGTIWVTELFMRLRSSPPPPPPSPGPTTTAAPRPPPAPRVTVPPRPRVVTTTTAPPAPAPEPEPEPVVAPPPPPVAHARLVLVLEELRRLDVGLRRPAENQTPSS